MLEEFGLTPFSKHELKEKILEEYEDDLKFIKENKLKILEIDHEKMTEDDFELDYAYHCSEENIFPLSIAYSGFLDALKCEMAGGDIRLVPLSKKALKSAMEHPELQIVAKNVIRFLITPDQTWKEAVEEIGEEFELSKDLEPGKYGVYVYDYFQTILASGRRENKINYLSEVLKEWKNKYKEKLEYLTWQLKVLGEIPLCPLTELEDLEYKKWVTERLKLAIENKGIVGNKIPFYCPQSIILLEDYKQGYRFRAYGNADYIVKNIEERTIDAGLKVQKIKESSIKPIIEERLFSLII